MITRRTRTEKFALVDRACEEHGVRSVAELGGCWGVDGDYLFHAVERHGVDRAVEVDTHPTDGFNERAKQHPQVELIQGNFGSREVAERIGEVDAVLLYDVLLHQVAPDWDEVLEMYADRARCLLIFNQQWTGGEKTIRLLELGRDEYLANVPMRDFHETTFDHLDQIHPVHERPWRDVHHLWQWGITDEDLIATASSLGFKRAYDKDVGNFPGLRNFHNRAFIFTRD